MSDQIISESELASYLQLPEIPPGKSDFLRQLVDDMVREDLGDIDPVPARVRGIAVESMARSYRNPKGATASTKSIEDWTQTERWEAAGRAGAYLTDEERAIIRSYRVDAPRPRRYGSIQLNVPGYPANGCR